MHSMPLSASPRAITSQYDKSIIHHWLHQFKILSLSGYAIKFDDADENIYKLNGIGKMVAPKNTFSSVRNISICINL